MKYINYTLLTLMLLMATVSAADARIDYYRLIKTRYANGRIVTASGNTGQFICRNGAECFDTNVYGCDICNGRLVQVNRQGTITKYNGPSYYGTNTSYTFDDSDGTLNIRDEAGNIYVYRIEQAPAGRTSSSLIKHPEMADCTPATIEDFPDLAPSPSPTQTPERRNEPERKKRSTDRMCTTCYGRGYCPLCTGHGRYQPNLGSSTKVKCSRCNGTGRCPSCHGTGRRN